MRLYRLMYKSNAVGEIGWRDVRAIFEYSEARNRALGITGGLLFTNRQFLQIIEGDRGVISRLYNKISNDERHAGCVLMMVGPIKDRSFEDWGMYGVRPGIMDPEELAALHATYGVGVDNQVPIPEEPGRAHALLLEIHARRDPSL